jgi:hypothetical protein
MMQVGKAVGMVTLNDALVDLVNKKLVAPEEAYAKAIDKVGIESQLKRIGFDPSKAAGGASGAQPGAPARPVQPAAAVPVRS